MMWQNILRFRNSGMSYCFSGRKKEKLLLVSNGITSYYFLSNHKVKWAIYGFVFLRVCIAMLQIDKIWDQLFPAEQERIVRLLIKKVVVTPHNIEVQFLPNGLERLAAELNLPAAKEEVEVTV
jgi:hypothetical protein